MKQNVTANLMETFKSRETSRAHNAIYNIIILTDRAT